MAEFKETPYSREKYDKAKLYADSAYSVGRSETHYRLLEELDKMKDEAHEEALEIEKEYNRLWEEAKKGIDQFNDFIRFREKMLGKKGELKIIDGKLDE